MFSNLCTYQGYDGYTKTKGVGYFHLCSKRCVLGFYKQAIHRTPGDEPFFSLGSIVHITGDGPIIVH